MKKILSVLIAVFLVLGVVFFARNLIVKAAVETGVKVVTGLSLRMGGLDIGIVKTFIRIENLQLFNPDGFPDKVMVDLPEIYIAYDLPEIIKGKLHFPEIRIHLREFSVVKNRNGALNLDALKPVESQKKEDARPTPAGKTPAVAIDRLELRIEKVFFKDYSSGGEPSVREFNVNVHEKYERITNPESIVRLIVVKALANTTIASLTQFDVGALKGTVSDTLSTSTQLAGATVERAGEVFSQATEQAAGAEDLAKSAAGSLKNTASSWKSKLQKAVS